MLQELEDHHLQLQVYLSNWGKRQQQILEAARHAEASTPQKEAKATETKGAVDSEVLDVMCSVVASVGDDPFQPEIKPTPTASSGVSGKVTKTNDLSEVFTHHLRKHRKQADRVHNVLNRLVSSFQFEILCTTTICVNSVTMGIAAQYAADNPDRPTTKFLSNLEYGFVLFFFVECLLRLLALGKYFFIGTNWKWNLFDLVIVLTAACEQVLEHIGNSMPIRNIVFLRIAKLVKLTKLARIIRLSKSLKQLRLVLNSILGSLQPICWSVVLMLLVIYGFSICFLQGVSTSIREDMFRQVKDYNPEDMAIITEHWSSILKCMHTLFVISFGGDDWFGIAAPLRVAGISYYTLFLAYLVFFMIVVMNTMTAVFVDGTSKIATLDDDEMLAQELEREEEYVGQLECLFDHIDHQGNGEISYDQFCSALGDERLLAFARSLGIEINDCRYFFGTLSNYGHLPVDVKTFVQGCIKLKGNAKSIDLHAMSQTVKHTYRQVQTFARLSSDLKRSIQELHETKLFIASEVCLKGARTATTEDVVQDSHHISL